MSPISTSMIIGPSVPSSSLRGGKEIAVSEESYGESPGLAPFPMVDQHKTEADVVILYISSIDLGILSYRRLINPGWVIPCINPEILMHSGAPSTSRTSALYLSMKSSVDSPSLCIDVKYLQPYPDCFVAED
ncbi:hypothetical protein Tco_0668323 [Tanacetum coccineum]